MKDLSLYLLKNSFGLKMKKGFRNLCNGESSTSILDPQKAEAGGSSAATYVAAEQPPRHSRSQTKTQPTLEEMILQLEMEEKMMGGGGGGRRRGRLDSVMIPPRMSCVSSCDILRSAKNALNQYPRFSLDGKDSMYRSSFRNKYEFEVERRPRLPPVVGGESVIWCKPGVVGKLMGLDAMPVPLNTNYRRERLSAILRRQKQEMERRRLGGDGGERRRSAVGSCSRAGYCVVKKPVEEMGRRRYL